MVIIFGDLGFSWWLDFLVGLILVTVIVDFGFYVFGVYCAWFTAVKLARAGCFGCLVVCWLLLIMVVWIMLF